MVLQLSSHSDAIKAREMVHVRWEYRRTSTDLINTQAKLLVLVQGTEVDWFIHPNAALVMKYNSTLINNGSGCRNLSDSRPVAC